MRHRIALILSIITLVSMLSGCSPELHERLLVSAIGIDSNARGWNVTVLAYDPSEERETSFTGLGGTVASALEEIVNQTGKTPMYSHCRAVIFGRSCAEYGLKSCMDFFVRHYDSRPNMKVLISDTSAESILSLENDREQIDLSVLTDIERYSSFATSADLISLINGTFSSSEAAVLPIIQRDDDITVIGNGLLNEMKLVKELNIEESRGMLILTESLDSGELVFETESCGKISVYNRDCSSTIKFTGTKENPKFKIDVRIKGEISTIEYSMKKLSSDVFSEIESLYAGKAMNLIEQFLSTAVIDCGTDVVGFGNAILVGSSKLRNSIQMNLSEYLKNAEYIIDITAIIDRIEEEDVPYF